MAPDPDSPKHQIARGDAALPYKTTGDDGLGKGETCTILLKLPGKEELVEIDVSRSQTVRALKDAAGRKYGSTAKWTFDGEELEDKSLLSDCNIEAHSIVVAQMQVYVFFLGKQGFLLDVEPDTPVEYLKGLIEGREPEFLVENQRIIHGGNNLDDTTTLGQYGIPDNANLFVHVIDANAPVPQEGRMHIFVRSNATIHTLEVAWTDTVATVKNVLLERENILPEQQRLTFGGRDLTNDSQQLHEYDIFGDSLLDLVSGEKGGLDEQVSDGLQEKLGHPESSGTITIYFIREDRPGEDGTAIAIQRDATKICQAFKYYSRRVNVPLDSLQFKYGDFGELPLECELTANELGMSDKDVVVVRQNIEDQMAPLLQQMLNQKLLDAAAQVLDWTGLGADSKTAEDHIVITFDDACEEMRVRIDRNIPLLFLFSEFGDRVNADPTSLQFVHKARLLPSEAMKTAAKWGIDDGDVIHAIAKRAPTKASPPGKMVVHIMDGKDEKNFFRLGTKAKLSKVFKSFADRKRNADKERIDISNLRFLYGGTVFSPDSNGDTTLGEIGVAEGDTIYALIEKPQSTAHITPLSAKYILLKPLDHSLAPSIQVTEWDEAKDEVRSIFAKLIQHVAGYLVGPSVVMLALSLKSESNQSTAASQEVVNVFRGPSNPRRKLDFSKVESALAAKITDELIHSMLCAVDAPNFLRRVRFDNKSFSIDGHGLEPLRGSKALRKISVGAIQERRAGEVIESILDSPKCKLHTAVVPTSWVMHRWLERYLRKTRRLEALEEEYECSSSPCSNPSCDNVEDDVSFLTCARCRLFKFCCRQCLIDHWPTHKKTCNRADGGAAIKEAVD